MNDEWTFHTASEASFRLAAVVMVEALEAAGYTRKASLSAASLWFDVRASTIRRWPRVTAASGGELDARLEVLRPRRGMTGVKDWYRWHRRPRSTVAQTMVGTRIRGCLDRLRARFPEEPADAR